MRYFAKEQIEQFRCDGYLVVSGLACRDRIERIIQQADRELASGVRPLELEAEVGYPGAPSTAEAEGGATPRRLLQAFARGGEFRDWAMLPQLVGRVSELLGTDQVLLCQSHHNCLMTKYPRYSSDTLWHQDTRYWSFQPPKLVNAWLALGTEVYSNGGMQLLPGSQHWEVSSDRLDESLFFRLDHPINAAAVANARQIDLNAGDVLFFDAAAFHAASRNRSDRVKLSLVFTYHGAKTHPVAGSRSASLPEVPVFEPATG